MRLTISITSRCDSLVCLAFKVTNRRNPQRPSVTADYVQRVLSGTAQRGGSSGSPMSDQIGLQHSFLAAEAHCMTISLSQEGQVWPPQGAGEWGAQARGAL